jgi:hypothetical protein
VLISEIEEPVGTGSYFLEIFKYAGEKMEGLRGQSLST